MCVCVCVCVCVCFFLCIVFMENKLFKIYGTYITTLPH